MQRFGSSCMVQLEELMSRDWRVLCSPRYQTTNPMRSHGNFEKAGAEKFIRDAKTEHPERDYEMEEWPAA
jgi:hypothetical protein